jgi:thiol:disulfide interchange protein DsbD
MLNGLENSFQQALTSGSFGLALVLVFLGGVATSLTPCVYPMIAITVSVFGARQVKNRWEGAWLSTAFVLGIAALFTPLGLLAAMTGGVFGAALASPWVLVGLAVLFVALAASMFGAFDINLPASLRNRLAGVGGGGARGAFALGLVSALIAAPCTGPVLGFLLTWVGTTGQVVFGAVSLFVYSLGLGLLFWVVGTFSVSLPKSGKWLDWVKSVFGIVMLVAAVYYVRDLIPGLNTLAKHTPVFLGGSLLLVAVGFAAGAIHLSYYSPAWSVRIRKTIGVVLCVVGLLGVIGYATALPPGAKIRWHHNYAQAVQTARVQRRPLLVDFGASWCGACGELDRHTFSDARVVAESQRFVSVHIDLSPGNDTDENRAALAQYNQRGLPLVVLHDASGKEVERVTAFVEADVLLKKMKAVR